MPKNSEPLLKIRKTLGRSGLQVSPLCFGTLTLGPLQARLPLEEGAALLRYALEQGINFFDTAQLYGTYPYLRRALAGWRGEVVIASKSYAYTRQDMEKSLTGALKEMALERIGLFMLHEQESALTIKGHMEALEYLLRAKEKGLVQGVGLSTHHVAAVQAASQMREIDVIHPIINLKGIGIQDGTREDMVLAMERAARNGIGLFAMKPLGGGHLMGAAPEAFAYILSLSCLTATAVGMQCKEEIDYNCHYFAGATLPPEGMGALAARKRRLMVHDWCEGCGRCILTCRQEALFLRDGKVQVREENCILCGYCGSSCPQFCLKII